MDAIRLSNTEYKRKLANVEMRYNQMEFCDFNKQKVNEVHYLLISDGKKERFVIPFGEQDGCLSAPFSAPFCLPGEISKVTSAKHYMEAMQALEEYAKAINARKIRITFPPFLYGERQISYWLNAALLCNWKIAGLDLNYAFNLKKIQEAGYKNVIAYNAKKNLRIAHEKGNRLYCCSSEEDFEKAYKIIQTNRESKGYPLKMSFGQVEWTRRYVKGQWFSVINGEDQIAAAVVFPVTKHVAQVIYWGDVPENTCKAVNFLAEQLVSYYMDRGFLYLDIGPSTDCSSPNYGLISFKESIGCEASSKMTIEKNMESRDFLESKA